MDWRPRTGISQGLWDKSGELEFDVAAPDGIPAYGAAGGGVTVSVVGAGVPGNAPEIDIFVLLSRVTLRGEEASRLSTSFAGTGLAGRLRRGPVPSR